MLRRHHRFFQSIQMARDAVVVALAFFASYLLRFSFPDVIPFDTVSDPKESFAVGLLTAFVWPSAGWFCGLYASRRAQSVLAEVADVVRVTAVAFFILVTVTYFLRDVRYSRAVLAIWVVLCCVALSAVRMLSSAFLRRMRARGYNLRHVVIVGTGELARHVLKLIDQQTHLGFRVVGAVSDDGDTTVSRVERVDVLGTVNDLQSILQAHNVDQVIVALPIERLGSLKRLMDILSLETVDVRLIPDVAQYMTLCGSVEEFGGLPIINLQTTPLSGWNLVTKRVFDFAIGGLLLLMIAPLMAILGLIIKLTDRGPIFFTQVRVGLDGRRFAMYKFRTMRVDAERHGAQMTAKGDPRCTPIGTFLRKLSIDELPQLWNVVVGDMSLVGPRPEQPRFIEDFKREIPRYALRHKIKAGMTGWAQINGRRGNTSIKERIDLDLYYIENWSLVLDFKILLRTVLGGFISPHAY